MTKVEEKFSQAKAKLEAIINSKEPKSAKLLDAYEEKLRKANNYLEELMQVEDILELSGEENSITTLSTLIKKQEEADFTTVVFDGFFLKVVTVSSFPFSPKQLICMASLSTLEEFDLF